jgi:hypothetical protein
LASTAPPIPRARAALNIALVYQLIAVSLCEDRCPLATQ